MIFIWNLTTLIYPIIIKAMKNVFIFAETARNSSVHLAVFDKCAVWLQSTTFLSHSTGVVSAVDVMQGLMLLS